jgi:hypothetical protein
MGRAGKIIERLRGMSEDQWVTLCRRTVDPKLAWLENELHRAGIKTKRDGESFRASILKVQKKDEDKAWKILGPIDDMRDDNPKFRKIDYAREFLRE